MFVVVVVDSRDIVLVVLVVKVGEIEVMELELVVVVVMEPVEKVSIIPFDVCSTGETLTPGNEVDWI